MDVPLTTTRCVADVSLESLTLNGQVLCSKLPPAKYYDLLGSTVRLIEPQPPAPWGHRNNQIHMFDNQGLYLIEHHATRLVDSVVIVLWLEEAPFQPASEFCGPLTVGGVHVFPGMAEDEFVGGTITFVESLRGEWNAKGAVYVALSTKGKKQPTKRRTKRRYFVYVSICF